MTAVNSSPRTHTMTLESVAINRAYSTSHHLYWTPFRLSRKRDTRPHRFSHLFTCK